MLSQVFTDSDVGYCLWNSISFSALIGARRFCRANRISLCRFASLGLAGKDNFQRNLLVGRLRLDDFNRAILLTNARAASFRLNLPKIGGR